MGNVVKVVFVSKTTLSRRLVVGFATQNSWKMEQRIAVAVAGNVRWTKTLLFSCYWWLWWSSRARVYNLTGEGEIASQTRKKNDIHYCLGFCIFPPPFSHRIIILLRRHKKKPPSSHHHGVLDVREETETGDRAGPVGAESRRRQFKRRRRRRQKSEEGHQYYYYYY